MINYIIVFLVILHIICLITNYWFISKFSTSHKFNIGYWKQCDIIDCFPLSSNDIQTKYIKNARIICILSIIVLLFVLLLYQNNSSIIYILFLLFIYINLNILVITYWFTKIKTKLKESGTIYNKPGLSLIIYILLTVSSILLLFFLYKKHYLS